MLLADSVSMVNWASGETLQMTEGMVAGAIPSTSLMEPSPYTIGINRMVFLFVALEIRILGD